MECQRNPETIAEFVDGELGPAERAELEAHLPGCAPCRERVAAERRLGELLAALPAIEAPGDFEARFWARIGRERDAAPSLWDRLRGSIWPRVLTLGVAAAGLTLLLLLPRGGTTPPTAALRVPEADRPIVADSEDFELVQDPDMDAISMVDVLESWDDGSPAPDDAPPS
ncbi:MAG TPA: zf-HC2 domain-containing protein [Myxococcota bacterium]|nr:zf-HC2 domain-containing protein [Myxococcota bacterium]